MVHSVTRSRRDKRDVQRIIARNYARDEISVVIKAFFALDTYVYTVRTASIIIKDAVFQTRVSALEWCRARDL